jgi:CRP-like cAMP-binding protein
MALSIKPTATYAGQAAFSPLNYGGKPWARRAPTATADSVDTAPFGNAQTRNGDTAIVCAVSLRFPLSRPALTAIHDPQRNQLLAALSPDELLQLNLQLVPMALGQVLHESGDVQLQVYFPIDSIISLLYVLEDGGSAEISVVGNEGVVGVVVFMGGESTPSRTIVQSAGYAYQMVGQTLKELFHSDAAMQLLLLRYTQSLLTQMAQTAVCNRHHSVDQQLCRWLLLSLDRLTTNQLVMTQELIANMLGVRREGVTEAAGKLHALGIIRYSRGRITVLDRQKLERRSCECYAVVKRETDRLRPPAHRSKDEELLPIAG